MPQSLTPLEVLALLRSASAGGLPPWLDIRSPVITPPGIPNRPGAFPPPTLPTSGATPGGGTGKPLAEAVGEGGGGRGGPSPGETGQGLSDWGPGEDPTHSERTFGPTSPTGWGTVQGALTGATVSSVLGLGPALGLLGGSLIGSGLLGDISLDALAHDPALQASIDAANRRAAEQAGWDYGGYPAGFMGIGTPTDPTATQTGPAAGPDPGETVGPTPEGWAGQREGERTGEAPGSDAGDDSGGRDAGSAGDAGTGTGGESGSGYVAKGGVFKAARPTTKTFGEAGKETGVFVPEWMKRPGIQGKERQIVAALETLLRELRRGTGAKKEKR